MVKLVSKLINFICAVIILGSVFILISVVFTGNSQAPNVMGYSAFRVLTGSMKPTLQVDDLVVVKHVDPSAVQVGDIISFYSQDEELDGMVNTHRVQEITEENGNYTFVTKGDANVIADKTTVSQADLIGVVVFSSHFLGVLVHLLSNPVVFFPLIMIPLVLILIINLRDAVRSAKAIAKNEEEEAIRQAVADINKRREVLRAQQADAETAAPAEDATAETAAPAENAPVSAEDAPVSAEDAPVSAEDAPPQADTPQQ